MASWVPRLTKMTSPALTLLLLATCTAAWPWPQDIGTGMMLGMGQLQQLAETGGGLRHDLSGEILGQRISGGLNLGIGEAMSQLPMGRRRRSNDFLFKTKL